MEDGRPRLSSTTSLARALSVAGHPFLLFPLTVAALTRSVFWMSVIAATTTIPLLAISIRNVRRGRWSDLDVSRHEQRSSLYYAGLPLIGVGALILYLLGAGPELMRGALAGALMFTTGLIVTRWMKISLHMMSAALCAVWLVREFPMSAFTAIPFVAAIAWSRHRLRRHSWLEIGSGIALGTIAGVLSIVA